MIFVLFHTFLRSFFLQALWNFERMQNMGFAFSVAPLLKKATKSKAEFDQALRRHTQFFNTHPYFSTIVMGVVYRKEVERSSTLVGEDTTLTVLKDSMGGAFGAIGDHVLWGTWRPFCALMAMGIGLLVASSAPRGPETLIDGTAPVLCAKFWVAGFLSMFNSIHLWLRWRGLQKAVAEGPGVVRWVQSLHLQAWASQIRRLGLLWLFAMILGYFYWWTASPILLWMFAVLLGTMIMKRWELSGVAIFYLIGVVAMGMTAVGIHWP